MARTAHRPPLGAVLDAVPIGIALTLLAALPSFFNLATDQVFEEQKSLVLRAGAVMAVPGVVTLLTGAHLRRAIAGWIPLLFLALVIALAMSTILAGMSHDALWGAYLRRHGLVTWLALAVLFVAMVAAARSSSGRELIVHAVIIGAIWPAAYLLLQRAGIDVVQWIAPSEGFLAGSTFGNHVFIGGYLALVIPLTVMQALRGRWAWGALAVLQLAALVASGSRGAALALLAAGVVAVWRLAPKAVAAAVAVAAASVLVILFTVPSARPAALAARLDPQVGSARVRILIWGDTRRILGDSGLRVVMGHGPESLRSLFPAHYSAEIGRWEQIDAMPDRAHNEILDMLVSGGVVATALELAFFAAVVFGAMRLADPRLQAGLAAAAVAHIVELQFGIASSVSRLAFLAVAAVVAGAQLADDREPPLKVPAPWLMVAALAGALAPWVSTLPSVWRNPIASGGEAEFIEYLERLSVATPVLYAVGLIIAIGIARSAAAGRRSSAAWWWQLPMLGAAAWAIVPLAIVPSRADGFSAAGRSYGRDGRWPEATVALSAAIRDAPAVPEYHEEFARASIEWAMRSAPARRDSLLAQARAAYERAIELAPFDPLHARHLASLYRIRASLLDGPARAEALSEADRICEQVSRMAPSLTSLWVEWAWVDIDRARPAEAIRKLDHALVLDRQRGDAQRMRADLIAGRRPLDAR
jgi:O-antigen ligase